MELLEGAPLSDHVSSLAERRSRFSEERVWKLYVQLVLGLRYLHKEKHIVHRDLSPANIMIRHDDKLTISEEVVRILLTPSIKSLLCCF